MAKPKKKAHSFMPTGSMNHPDRRPVPEADKVVPIVDTKPISNATEKISLGASKPTGYAEKVQTAEPNKLVSAPVQPIAPTVVREPSVEPIVTDQQSDANDAIASLEQTEKAKASEIVEPATALKDIILENGEAEVIHTDTSLEQDELSITIVDQDSETTYKPAEAEVTATKIEQTPVSSSKELAVLPKRRKAHRFNKGAFTAYITGARRKLPGLPSLSKLRGRHTRSATWLVIGSGLLLVGTQLTLVLHPQVGIYTNMAALLVLAALALMRTDLRKLAISIAIIPITQMVLSTIIVTNAFERATIFYVSLLVLTLCYRYMFTLDEPVEPSKLHWKGHLFGIPLMFMIGQFVGLIGYAFLRHHYPYHGTALPLVALGCVVFAFVEEMLLRGLIQQQAAKVVHPLLAAGLAAALYSVLAFSHVSLLTLGPAIISGVVLALVYYARQNVFLCVVVNAFSKLLYVGLVATFILR